MYVMAQFGNLLIGLLRHQVANGCMLGPCLCGHHSIHIRPIQDVSNEMAGSIMSSGLHV